MMVSYYITVIIKQQIIYNASSYVKYIFKFVNLTTSHLKFKNVFCLEDWSIDCKYLITCI